MLQTYMRAIAVLMVLLPSFWGLETVEASGKNRCEYWVAPSPRGDDANPGTIGKPWATLEFAADNVDDNHCTVWFSSGIYEGSNRLNRRFETPTVFRSIIPYRAILESPGGVVLISGGKNIIIEGFNIRHSGPGAKPLVVAIDQSRRGWSEKIILRDNIIHDSYNNDLLKIYNGCIDILIENNLFYNQGDSEEQIDVNSVFNVTIQNNIFLNSFESSGRQNKNLSKQYIVIKDSNGPEDGLIGSRQVNVRGNVFLNWQGQEKETLIQVGLDGKPYFEAQDVHIENNLIIGNSGHQAGAAFGVRGAKDVFFINNTVVGDLPSLAYAFRITISGENPRNENIYFANNIWSDPTGTMGADLEGGENEFSDGDLRASDNIVVSNNLYWNGGFEIPEGELGSPQKTDDKFLIQNPLLDMNYEDLVLPFWNGDQFLSGSESIREEYYRLVTRYGALPQNSPALDLADLDYSPTDDILDHPRGMFADIGAYEYVDETIQLVKKLEEVR